MIILLYGMQTGAAAHMRRGSRVFLGSEKVSFVQNDAETSDVAARVRGTIAGMGGLDQVSSMPLPRYLKRLPLQRER